MSDIQPTPPEEQLLLPELQTEADPALQIAAPVETGVDGSAASDASQPVPSPLLPALIPSRQYALLTIGSLVLAFVIGGSASFSLLSITSPHLHAAIRPQAAAVASAVPLPDMFATVKLQAQSAYVYDIATHQVLYTLNPDAERPLASLTKIAMALAVSEVLSPDTLMTMPFDITTPDGISELKKGTIWPARDILDFTLIASSNQGADALALAANDPLHAKYPLSPSTGATVWRMNNLAQSLGLTSMLFSNDNGLDLTPTQSGAYGSARDVGTLVAYAASTTPDTFTATTHSSMSFKNADGVNATANNTDTALGAIPGIIMGKTGYTDLAGGNLAVVFDAGVGHPVVAVVMGSTEEGRFTDMKQLVAASLAAVSQGQ